MAFQDVKIQRPVNAHIKSVRTIYREPENPVRSAFAKLMREHDKTRKVYDVDPYAEVYTLSENLYGIFTHSLDGMGDPWIYLIVGPEKALLIDTGFGLGNLKGLVHELIGDKPYYVACTHCAYDHSYGNTAFDRVYCHEYEAPSLKARMRPDIWDYLFDENGNGIWADFPREDLVPFKEYEVVGVPNGYTFNLGGDYDIELIHLPGHACGHAAFLNKKERYLIVGDDCCVGAVGVGGGRRDGNPNYRYGTVEALRNELVKLVARMDEFDNLFPGHGPLFTGPIMLASLLEACNEVLDDPNSYDVKSVTERNGVVMTQYKKKIFESGYLQYNTNSLYMDKPVPEGV